MKKAEKASTLVVILAVFLFLSMVNLHIVEVRAQELPTLHMNPSAFSVQNASLPFSLNLTITNVTFIPNNTNATNSIVLSIKNTGTKTVTIGTVKINNNAAQIDPASTLTYTTSSSGNTGNVTLDNVGWAYGNAYQFNLYDGSGNGIGSYQSNSPGS